MITYDVEHISRKNKLLKRRGLNPTNRLIIVYEERNDSKDMEKKALIH